MKPITNKSFTLIELLVVIAIVGLITNISYSNYIIARQKSRDAKRKSDLYELRKALEMYRQNQQYSVFPTPQGNPPKLSASNSTWIDEKNSAIIYMNKVPVDPVGQLPTPYYYQSPRVGSDKNTFLLCACLENSTDPDAQDCSAEPNCNGIICSTNKCFKLTEP